MFDALLRDLRLLGKAEALILNAGLELALRRGALLLLASLIAAFGLAMLDVAAFFALRANWGAIDAAAAVGVADIAIAGALAILASRSGAGPGLDFALEVRREALAAIASDAAALRAPLDELRSDIRGMSDSVRGFLHNPLGGASGKLLIPAILALIRSLRGDKATNPSQP